MLWEILAWSCLPHNAWMELLFHLNVSTVNPKWIILVLSRVHKRIIRFTNRDKLTERGSPVTPQAIKLICSVNSLLIVNLKAKTKLEQFNHVMFPLSARAHTQLSGWWSTSYTHAPWRLCCGALAAKETRARARGGGAPPPSESRYSRSWSPPHPQHRLLHHTITMAQICKADGSWAVFNPKPAAGVRAEGRRASPLLVSERHFNHKKINPCFSVSASHCFLSPTIQMYGMAHRFQTEFGVFILSVFQLSMTS